MKNGERRPRGVPLLGLLPGRVLPVVPLKISRCAENEFDTDRPAPKLPRPRKPYMEWELGRAELPFPSFFLSLLILDRCYLYFLAFFSLSI